MPDTTIDSPQTDWYLPRGISQPGLLKAIDESNGIQWDPQAVSELREQVEAEQ